MIFIANIQTLLNLNGIFRRLIPTDNTCYMFSVYKTIVVNPDRFSLEAHSFWTYTCISEDYYYSVWNIEASKTQ